MEEGSSALPSSRSPARSTSSHYVDAPSSPRLTALNEFADRIFSSRSELVPVPHEPSARFSFSTLLRYVGPGLLTSVAFVDPGNIESDLQAGSYAGYQLLWVVAFSTFMGLLFQSLAVRLGTVTGKDLATHCSEQFGARQVHLLWLMTQIAIIGSDIQEIVGSAIAFRLLFGLPLWVGCLLTALDTLTFLGLHATGLRKLEALFAVLILIMVVCFFANFFLVAPEPSRIVGGIVIPRVTEQNAIQAASILGAVIMPHNIFLHSALVLSRDVDRTKVREVKEASFYFTLEAGLALFVAFMINTAIVSVFAQGFYAPKCEEVTKNLVLQNAFKEIVAPPFACVPSDHDSPVTKVTCETGIGSAGTCQPIGLQIAGKPLEAVLGSSASTLWAIGLLAAGQSSTVTGTYAGQFVMEGMLKVQLPNWKRVAFTRLVALFPATFVAVIASHDYLAADRLDEWLNVVQSIQLPFALVPLLTLCGDSRVMGQDFSLSPIEKKIGWGLGIGVIAVNVFLLADKMQTSSPLLIIFAGCCAGLYLWFLQQFGPRGAGLYKQSSNQPEQTVNNNEMTRLITEDSGNGEAVQVSRYL